MSDTSGRPPLAAFDFDGTLAKGDSLLPFLVRLLGGQRVGRSLLRHAGPLGMMSLGRGNRDKIKERFIAHALAGHPAHEVHSIGAEFAQQLLRTRMFPTIVQRVEWHRNQIHDLILVSASLDVYLQPLADELGFDAICTTRLEIVDGYATGNLIGENVRAAEKVKRVEGYLGTGPRPEMWAYGNSSGDHELLAMADHAYYVDRAGKYAPWKGKGRPD